MFRITKFHILFCLFITLLNSEGQGNLLSTSVDEVIAQNDVIYLFNFSTWSIKDVRQNDSGRLACSSQWKKLIKPNFRFSPKQVLAGPPHNFFVLEDGNQKIWQLDTGFQVLSSIDLPREFRNQSLEQFKLYYSQDQKFNFVDGSSGLVYQFVEFGGGLKLHRKIKVGLSKSGFIQVQWPPNHSYGNLPYLHLEREQFSLYSLFFIDAQSIQKEKYFLGNDNEWNGMVPQIRPLDEGGFLLRFPLDSSKQKIQAPSNSGFFQQERQTPLNNHWVCFAPAKAEIYSCPIQ